MMQPSPQPLAQPSVNRWLNLTRVHADSLLFSAGFCTLALLLFLAGSDEFLHWFILPVWACGVLVGTDAFDWARGRVAMFDPVGVIGVLGMHFFFLAPLMHVSWDYWLEAPILPLDWRPSLGLMAVFNLLGLLAYRYCRDLFLKRGAPTQTTFWKLDQSRFVLLAGIVLFISACLQIIVYRQYGGISGYIQVSTDLANPTRMQGMGLTFLISEIFPVVALMLFAVKAREKLSWQSWLILGGVLLTFLVLRIFFGGLRGSRSTIIFALFWAVGALHFYVRLIPRYFIFIGIAFMVTFMYGYSFFKGYSYYQEGGGSVFDSQRRAQLEQESGLGIATVLLGDLGRSDIQAFLLYRLWSPENSYLNDYQYVWGRTYLGAAAILIPRSIWPNRPNTKMQEGAEIFYGRGSYIEGEVWSSKVHGLAGETMLNFGPLPIPIAFALFGLLVSKIRVFLLSLRDGDSRLLLVPFLVLLCILILNSDSDNLIFFTMQNIGIPSLLVLAASRRFEVQTVVQRFSTTQTTIAA